MGKWLAFTLLSLTLGFTIRYDVHQQREKVALEQSRKQIEINEILGDSDSMFPQETYPVIPTATNIVIPVTTQPTAKPTVAPTTTPKPTYTVVPTTKIPTPTPTATPTPTFDYSKPWTVAVNCPQITQRCIPCTSGSDCRYEPKKTHGFRGWACQNNNPGNIRNASTDMSKDSKNAMIVRNGGVAACGVRYDSRGGSYFVFRTYDIGFNALKAYIKAISKGEHSSYKLLASDNKTIIWKCGDCTLTQFFSKYAPADSTYASTVATLIGEPVTQKLSFIVEFKLDAFATAIKKHEGFITN